MLHALDPRYAFLSWEHKPKVFQKSNLFLAVIGALRPGV